MKGLPRSLSRGPALAQPITKQHFSFSALPVSVDGLTGVGFGSAVIGALPEGNILMLGAVAYVALLGPTSANLVDAFDGDFGIGSTPASDGTIDAGDVDIIASTTLPQAVAEAVARTRGVNAVQAMLDNTANALEINLSILVDDADIDADGIIIAATGDLWLAYIMLGDD